MKIKKTIIILSVLMLFLLIAGVSANDINTTDEISTTNDVDENIESSTINPEVIEEDLNDNSDNKKLEYSYEDNLSDEGEFIDVNDAYVYLNQFRNETGVWQWNDDDTTKTVFNTNESNQLKPLARDLNLEETAKIRAKELVEKWGHERPDGTMCFTAFPDGFNAKGENIASGQTSANEVTEVWKETNDPYSGQGHRRNMLSSMFNCVGIAGYKLNGVIYWVQDFGYTNNINEGEIIYPNTNNNSNTQNEEENNTKNKGTFTELNELIQNASENSVIKLDKDYSYDNTIDSIYKNGIIITKSITIIGQNHIIDGKHQSRFLHVKSDVTLINVNIVNANANSGGAIHCPNSNFTAVNCTFTNNSAYSYSGGAIDNGNFGKIYVMNCIFINNSAHSTGGAINGAESVVNCTFINNSAQEGGAISGGKSVVNCTFINNSAIEINDTLLTCGGAIHSARSVVNCTFANNSAIDAGGAIHFQSLNDLALNCIFINNSANKGGAIDGYGRVSVMNCTFINNNAEQSGAINNYGYVVNCTFINNSASRGGAIDNFGGYYSIGSVVNCTFINNSAIRGGAIYNSAGLNNASVLNCIFINNSAYMGGAIYASIEYNMNYTGGRMPQYNSIVNCSFINNSANPSGGAVYIELGNGTVVNCTFVNNSANNNGGAVYIELGNGTVVNSNFINNQAKEGDAIYITSKSKTTNIIVNSKFINNNTPKDHLFISGNDFIIDYSNLINKTGVDIKLENITILNCTFEKTDIINSTSNKNQNNAIINKDDNINSNPTINKKATKITAKKKTFKAKTKTKKYTITLKAGKKAVKKVKVYLKIGKKTFKATTNKNGKATFKIKLNKKGTYKSKITFKGSKIYKATTKKVTIKIK